MGYFDKRNCSLLPFEEINERIIFYNIDFCNKTLCIEFYIEDIGKQKEQYLSIVHEALRVAFDEKKMRKIYIYVIRDNIRMIAILSKLNFVMEAIHREHYYDTVAHDVVVFSVLNNEFKNNGISYGVNYNSY